MPLRHALVDRARAVFEAEDPQRAWVDGAPQAALEYGKWFRCRVVPDEPTEATGVSGLRGLAARGYHRIEASGKLLVGLTYEDGTPLTDEGRGRGRFKAFDDGMRLEVASTASPEPLWFVDTGVQPIRKRKRLVGFMAGVRRSREPRVATTTLAPGQPDVALPENDPGEYPAGEIGL